MCVFEDMPQRIIKTELGKDDVVKSIREFGIAGMPENVILGWRQWSIDDYARVGESPTFWLKSPHQRTLWDPMFPVEIGTIVRKSGPDRGKRVLRSIVRRDQGIYAYRRYDAHGIQHRVITSPRETWDQSRYGGIVMLWGEVAHHTPRTGHAWWARNDREGFRGQFAYPLVLFNTGKSRASLFRKKYLGVRVHAGVPTATDLRNYQKLVDAQLERSL